MIPLARGQRPLGQVGAVPQDMKLRAEDPGRCATTYLLEALVVDRATRTSILPTRVAVDVRPVPRVVRCRRA